MQLTFGDPGEDSFQTDEDDVHICKKCNLAFTNIQQYLEHKVKHDHYKVKYCRSAVDKRMIMPTLVHKSVKKEIQEGQNQRASENKHEEQKENAQQKPKGPRGKIKKELDDDLVIKEKLEYICTRCNRKFNRKASLRRHQLYDHPDEPEEVEDTPEDPDADVDYKPTRVELKEDQEEDDQPRIIEIVPKKQKLTEEEKANRKFSCHICDSRFKELPVLNSHMLTHSNRRDFFCRYEGCSYSFKTKGGLKRHLRRHTGERPFPCEMCGRSFSESGALTRHMKSRVSCVLKADSDLPRYGTKWRNATKFVSQISVATSGRVTDNPELGESQAVLAGSEPSLNCNSDQEEEMEETLIALPAVVEVLDTDLATSEILPGEIDQDGIEQRAVEVIIQDECIDQFVQTETEIGMDQLTTCKVCKDDFVTVEALKIHLRTHLADTAFRCWLCHYNTDNKELFIDHMFSQHNVQLKGSDPLSNLRMGTQSANEKGDTKETGDNLKDAQLAVKQLLELPSDPLPQDGPHLSQGTRLLYRCPICSRKFRGNNYLRLHMRNHTGLRPHHCTECEKSFITKDTLTKHMGVHLNERNFKCGECGKLFKRMSHVREHLKIHTSTRPFPCSICDKFFKTNNAMKVHLRTHTDILPYECNFCHRRFREKGSLLRHTRLHTGEKPYECRYCGRCFSEHGTLNRHLKAKVSCTEQLQEARGDITDEDKKDYPTVLAEFSSVVADTQQYMVPQDAGDDNLLGEIHEAQQAAEYVVVQTDDEGQQIQNVEIITDSEGNTMEGVQVSENFLVIANPSGDGMRILDNRTGETVAVVPVTTEDDSGDNESQTVMVTAENEIEAVAMVPLSSSEVTLEHVLLPTSENIVVDVVEDSTSTDQVDEQEEPPLIMMNE